MALIRVNKQGSVDFEPYLLNAQATTATKLTSGTASTITNSTQFYEFNLGGICSAITLTTDMYVTIVRKASDGTLSVQGVGDGTYTLTNPEEIMSIGGSNSSSRTVTVTATF